MLYKYAISYVIARDVGEKTLTKMLVLENTLSIDCNTSPYLKCTDLRLVLMDQAKLNGYHGCCYYYFFFHFFISFALLILYYTSTNINIFILFLY